MKKFLFIIPPNFNLGERAKKRINLLPKIQYGVLSIITYIKAYALKDLDCKVVDMNSRLFSGMKNEDIFTRIKECVLNYQPDIIGINASYNFLLELLCRIATAAREKAPDALIVAGGACTAAYREFILNNCAAIDAICHAEGEIPVLDLVNASDMLDLLQSHRSWITKEKIDMDFTPAPTLIDNLDDIPPMEYEVFGDLEEYRIYHTTIRKNKIENEFCLPIHTSRGCPYNCVFCTAGSLHGKKVRKMSAKRVVADVKRMIGRYGMNCLAIDDDQFLLDRDRAKEILKGIAESRIALRAENGFTIAFIDDEISTLLKKAGLDVACIALESGSDYVLRHVINKPIKLMQVPPAVKSLRDKGLLINASLVIGCPGEKDEHRQETFEYAKKIGFDWCVIHCATPFMGSRLHDICIEKGYIKEESAYENSVFESKISTEDFTADQITKTAYLANLEINFVQNYRMRIGDYETAALYFEHVSSKYPFHAFAHYYLAKAYEGMGKPDTVCKAKLNRFYEIIDNDQEWLEYARHFELINA